MYSVANLQSCGHSLLSLNPSCLAAPTTPKTFNHRTHLADHKGHEKQADDHVIITYIVGEPLELLMNADRVGNLEAGDDLVILVVSEAVMKGGGDDDADGGGYKDVREGVI